MKVLLFLIFVKFSPIHALKIDCEFNLRSIGSFYGYSCSVINIFDFEGGQGVTEIRGAHQNVLTNFDVTGFFIEDARNLTFFPLDIENFFPNIVAIRLQKSNIVTLNGNELAHFINLYLINFATNYNLDRISGNLFASNPLMRSISITNSRNLEFVGENLLDHLENLEHVNFTNNLCINEVAQQEKILINNLIENLKINCLDNEASTTSTDSTTTSEKPTTSTTTTTEESITSKSTTTEEPTTTTTEELITSTTTTTEKQTTTTTEESTTENPLTTLKPKCGEVNEVICEILTQNKFLLDTIELMNLQIQKLTYQTNAEFSNLNIKFGEIAKKLGDLEDKNNENLEFKQILSEIALKVLALVDRL